MSLPDLLVSPSVLIGTVVAVMAAIAIGKFFPEHDLTFLQMLMAVAGFVTGVVLDLSGRRRREK